MPDRGRFRKIPADPPGGGYPGTQGAYDFRFSCLDAWGTRAKIILEALWKEGLLPCLPTNRPRRDPPSDFPQGRRALGSWFLGLLAHRKSMAHSSPDRQTRALPPATPPAALAARAALERAHRRLEDMPRRGLTVLRVQATPVTQTQPADGRMASAIRQYMLDANPALALPGRPEILIEI